MQPVKYRFLNFLRLSFSITCYPRQQSKQDQQFCGVIRKNWDLAGNGILYHGLFFIMATV